MTDPRRQRFAPYLRILADLLHLRDWTIVVQDRPPSEDAWASIWCTDGRKRAFVRLDEDFLTESPETQRHSLVHELVHCHFHAARQIAERRMTEHERDDFRLMFEYGIDATADALAPHMPLPTDDIEPEETPPMAKPGKKPQAPKKRPRGAASPTGPKAKAAAKATVKKIAGGF